MVRPARRRHADRGGVLQLTGWWDLLVGQMRVWIPGFTTVV